MTAEATAIDQVKFFGGDAESIRQEIYDDLRQYFGEEWSNFFVSSHGMILVQLVSRAIYRVAWHQNRAATDAFAATARLRKNAAYLARQMGYPPRGAAGASVKTFIALDEAQAIVTLLPQYTSFRARNGTYWYTDQDYSWAVGIVAAQEVTLFEGQRKSVSFSSSGQPNQRFVLPGIDPSAGTFLKSGSVEVYVGGVAWTAASVLSYIGGNEYEVWYATEPPYVVFGDALSANIPPIGANIEIRYVISQGLVGNIGPSQILGLSTPLVVYGTTINVTITQPDRAQGGLGLETVGEMMANATNRFKSRSVAVTSADFEAIAESFTSTRYGQVASAKAISPRGAEADSELTLALSGVRTVVGTPEGDTDAALTAITTQLALLETARTDALDLLAVVDLQDGIAGSQVDAAQTNIAEADVDALQAQGYMTTLQSSIPAGGAGSDQLTNGTRTTLLGLVTSALSEITSLRNELAATQSALASAEAALAASGTAATSMLAELDAAGTIDTIHDAIETQAGLIEVAVVGAYDGLETALQVIYDHVDGILAHDAKANLVQVAILARDADGFYAASTVGLRQALKEHFEDIKEPTVSIEVTDGSAMLVTPLIRISGTYQRGVREANVQSQIRVVMDAFIKTRKFGADNSLYIDEMYNVIDGVQLKKRLVIKLTGPTEYLDADGNLALPSHMCVTKPTYTFSLTEE